MTRLILLLALSVANALGADVDLQFASQFNTGNFLSNGASMPNGMIFEVGAFPSDFAPSVNNLNEWRARWQPLGMTDYLGPPATLQGFSLRATLRNNAPPFTPGAQLRVWGFTRPELGENSEWILLTDPAWTCPTVDELAIQPPIVMGFGQNTRAIIGTLTGTDFIMRTAKSTDLDGDGLTSEQEAILGSQANLADSDSSLTLDRNEAGDGISDFREDFDGDGVTNGAEFARGTNPLDASSKPFPHNFADWQALRAGAGSSPADNLDGDFWPDLLEYAFGAGPREGKPIFEPNRLERAGLRLEKNARGEIIASYWRPGELSDLRYSWEISGDLETWKETNLEATVAQGANGTEFVRLGDLSKGANPEIDAKSGFVRLRISLVGTEVSRVSEILGWHEIAVHNGPQSYGPAWLKPSIFAGVVKPSGPNRLAVEPSSLSPLSDLHSLLLSGRQYFVEFRAGPDQGQRVDVDEDASSAREIALDAASPNNSISVSALAGGRQTIALHEHHFLAEWLSPDRFVAGDSSTTSDQVSFLSEGQFQSLFLRAGVDPYWASEDLTPQNRRIMPPGQGLIIHGRGKNEHPANVLGLGQVRSQRFALPLRAGLQLIAGGFPTDQNPNGFRGRLMDERFTGSNESSLADEILVWRGDYLPEARGLDRYFLLDLGPGFRYWASTSLADQDASPIFRKSRVALLRMNKPVLGYFCPNPFDP